MKKIFFTLNCCHNNLCIECSDQLRNPQCPLSNSLFIVVFVVNLIRRKY